MAPFITEYTGTGAWVALTTTQTQFSGTLTSSIANAEGSSLEIRAHGAALGTTLIPMEYLTLQNCDLRDIEIKGNGLVLKALGSLLQG